jgi:hypothetical protein
VLDLASLKIGIDAVEIEAKTGSVLLTKRAYFVNDAIRHCNSGTAY